MDAEKDRPEQQSRRRWAWWWFGVVALAAAAAAVWLAATRARPAVEWRAVLEALGERKTVHGLGHIYLRDGSEWEYALWGRVEGPGACHTEGMARPVRLPRQSAGTPEKPNERLVMLVQAMDCYGEKGIIRRLAARAEKTTRARWVKLVTERVLLVELNRGEGLGEGTPPVDEWAVYVDPETMSVRRLELFTVEGGKRVLRGRCDYRYDQALPPGFGRGAG
jgi:hypothetical protein